MITAFALFTVAFITICLYLEHALFLFELKLAQYFVKGTNEILNLKLIDSKLNIRFFNMKSKPRISYNGNLVNIMKENLIFGRFQMEDEQAINFIFMTITLYQKLCYTFSFVLTFILTEKFTDKRCN